MTWSRRLPMVGGFVGLLLTALAVLAAALGAPQGRSLQATKSNRLHSSLISRNEPAYPDSWAVPANALRSANVRAVLPRTASANPSKASAHFVWPDGNALAVIYPLPRTPVAPVRQNYIEVWASGWTGENAAAELREALIASSIAGARMIRIAGVPAVAVAAHSPSDMDGENPALLWFVVDRVQYQVSGGDNMNDLIAIARDIVRSAHEAVGWKSPAGS